LTVKCRLVFTFQPEHHIPLIFDALALKSVIYEIANRVEFTTKSYPLTMFIPTKGTATEMERHLDSLPHNIICCSLSGDDGRDDLKRYGADWEPHINQMSCDLKSCDITLGNLIDPILFYLLLLGLSQTNVDRARDMLLAPKVFQHEVGGSNVTITLNHQMINCSGVALTTIITVCAKMLHVLKTAQVWDGELSTYRQASTQAATDLGLEVEFEDHGSTDGWSPMGRCSFLSSCAVLEDGHHRVIPKSFTKALVVKGKTLQDRGRTLDYAVAQRAMIPSLLLTPYGAAISGALRRHSSHNPVPEVPEPYKLNFDNIEPIRPETEFDYLRGFRALSDLRYEDYLAEIDAWQTVQDFPVDGNNFFIARAMASEHYGYMT